MFIVRRSRDKDELESCLDSCFYMHYVACKQAYMKPQCCLLLEVGQRVGELPQSSAMSIWLLFFKYLSSFFLTVYFFFLPLLIQVKARTMFKK